MEKTVGTLAEFEAEAARFAGGLAPRASGATLATLSGELGAGKTAFVKVAAKALGITEEITSPTFVILKAYDLPKEARFARLIHVDAYRLDSGAALAPLRFNDYLSDAKNLIMLEWPEKVADALPAPATRVKIEPLADGSRKITYA